MSPENDGEKPVAPLKPIKPIKSLRCPAAVRGKVVAVEVGPKHTKYNVHAALLMQHSEYFKKALSGPWKEADEGIIHLDDVDCDTFDIFVDWLYTGQLPTGNKYWVPNSTQFSAARWIAAETLRVKVCVFGDRFMAPEFRRTVQNNFVDHLVVNCMPTYYSAISYAFENLPSGHIILRFLVDSHCAYYEEKCDHEMNGEVERRGRLPNSFLVQVMLRYSKIINEEQRDLIRCDYHEHATEEEKERCKACTPDPDSDWETEESDPESNSESEPHGDGK